MYVIEQANEHEIPILIIHPMSNKRIDGNYKSQVIFRYESSESVENFVGACELDEKLFEKVKNEYHAKSIHDYAQKLISLQKTNSAKFVPIQQFVISTRTFRGDFEFFRYELDEPQLREHILRICDTKCPLVESEKIGKGSTWSTGSTWSMINAWNWIFDKCDLWTFRLVATFTVVIMIFVLQKLNFAFDWQQWIPVAFFMYFIYFLYSQYY